MKALALYTALALSVAASPAIGDNGEILTGNALNEAALIQALTPEEGDTIRTRSIRVERDSPTAQPAKPAAASLLITFATNSATLLPQARQQLDVVGRALNNDRLAEFKFAIEGHADSRGAADLNQRLSEARAQSVRRYLMEAQNVSDERLIAFGKGEMEPYNPKNPASAENRRVTIVTRVGE